MKHVILGLAFILSSSAVVASTSIDQQRLEMRQRIIESAATFSPYSTINSDNNPSSIVGPGVIRDVRVLSRYPAFNLSRSVYFWSDHSWSTYKGALGYRYADSEIRNRTSSDWLSNIQLLGAAGKSLYEVVSGLNFISHELSPTEKYDLLMGDKTRVNLSGVNIDGTLSAYSWNEGHKWHSQYGKVEKWFGICDGWAAASLQERRPVRSVDMLSPDGKTIRFLPADVKALNSLLWTKGSIQTTFAGTRCEARDIPSSNSESCFDVNPGTWHTVVVNQLALKHRSVVMDRTASREVWNVPVIGYDFWYENPINRVQTRDLNQAIVPYYYYRQYDPFARRRNVIPAYVVKVHMKAKYAAGTTPNSRDYDSPSFDRVDEITYSYDLEIDRNLQITGGEWYSKNHPDFLWRPIEDSKVTTVADMFITGPVLDAEGKIRADVRAHAPNASMEGQPIRAVLEEINLRVQNPPIPD